MGKHEVFELLSILSGQTKRCQALATQLIDKSPNSLTGNSVFTLWGNVYLVFWANQELFYWRPWFDICFYFVFLRFIFYFFYFSFIFISWRLITSQHCSGFCYTLTWISHGFTWIPHPDLPSHLPLHPIIPLGLPSAPAPSTCLMHPTWAGDLFHPR